MHSVAWRRRSGFGRGLSQCSRRKAEDARLCCRRPTGSAELGGGIFPRLWHGTTGFAGRQDPVLPREVGDGVHVAIATRAVMPSAVSGVGLSRRPHFADLYVQACRAWVGVRSRVMPGIRGVLLLKNLDQKLSISSQILYSLIPL